EVDHFDMKGQQNSGIDEEPSGGASAYVHVHDGVVDNSASSTSIAVSLGGESGGAIDLHQRVEHLMGLEGAATIGQTNDLEVDGLTLLSSTAFPANPTDAMLLARQINSDIQLRNIYIERTGTAGNGPCIDFESVGGSRATLDGIQLLQTRP